MTPEDVAKQVGDTLAKENGGGFGYVCISRVKGDPLDDGADDDRRCSVGEFLSREENQCGVWLIDGGWGFPPGAVVVKWTGSEWKNIGYASPANPIWMDFLDGISSVSEGE